MSCGPSYDVREKKEVKADGWSYEDKFTFSFEVKDTNQLYDLFLSINHDVSFPRQNIYVNVYTGRKGDELNKRQLSLEIGDKLGRWLGKCSEEKCERLIPLQTKTYFDKSGEYIFELEQYTRLDPLPKINSIEFLARENGLKEGV